MRLCLCLCPCRCLCLCLCVHPCPYEPICSSVSVSKCLSLVRHLYASMSVFVSARLCYFRGLSISVLVCPSVCLFLFECLFLFLCLRQCLRLCPCPFPCPYPCPCLPASESTRIDLHRGRWKAHAPGKSRNKSPGAFLFIFSRNHLMGGTLTV